MITKIDNELKRISEKSKEAIKRIDIELEKCKEYREFLDFMYQEYLAISAKTEETKETIGEPSPTLQV